MRTVAEMLASHTASEKDTKREYTPEEIAAYRQRVQERLTNAIRQADVDFSRRIIANSGLQKALDSLTFEKFNAVESWQKNMKNIAMQYVQNPQGWLMLCGQTGSGKTHLCTAAAGELLKRKIPVKYMRWRIDSARLKPNYSDAGTAERELKRLIDAPCLYIDDFWKGNVTDADVKLAFTLIDGRYITDRKTIISTELSPEQLIQIDEAIAGRILEKCGNNKFSIKPDKNKNYRLK